MLAKKIVFTTEQSNDIIDKYNNQQLSVLQISKEYGVSKQTIRRLLDKNEANHRGNRKYSFDENIFEEINNPEKAYWLGFILADGYINQKRATLQIRLSSIDHAHLIKFANFIKAPEECIKITQHSITGYDISTIHLYSRKLISDLNNLNIFQGKSCAKERVSKVPKELARDYIRGIWDGDGTMREKNLNVISSVEVLKYIQKHLRSRCDINIGKIASHCNTYRIYICKNRKRVLEYLYYKDCISLDRKYLLAHEIIEKLPS